MLFSILLIALQTFSQINSNQTILLTPGNYTLLFSSSTYNCKVVCQPGVKIDSVVFENNTLNNTLQNCSIFGNVLSLHNAENNLLNVTGNYSLNFADNSSSIAIGHFFHLIVHNQTGGYSVARFIEILPMSLVEHASYLISMAANMSQVYAVAKMNNLALPRWGLEINASSNGNTVFPIESEEIRNNKTITFSPYLYYTPYSGYDEVSQTVFNANSNVEYMPPYIKPSNIIFDDILPANKPVFWNFTFSIFNKSPNIFEIRNTPQSFPNGTIVARYYNVTNGTVSYAAGIQKPGTYAFLGMFFTPYDHENTTSEFYSVGLAYCSDVQYINLPGYYPFVYNSLTAFHVFWRTNQPCNIGETIAASNVTVNCRGGYVKEKRIGFIVENSNNVTIENCRLYGNGINALNSNIKILNTTFIATNASSIAITAIKSSLLLANVSFEGFTDLMNVTGNTTLQKTIPSFIPTSLSTTVPAVAYATSTHISNGGMIVVFAFVLLGLALIFSAILLSRKKASRKKASIKP